MCGRENIYTYIYSVCGRESQKIDFGSASKRNEFKEKLSLRFDDFLANHVGGCFVALSPEGQRDPQNEYIYIYIYIY